MSNMGEVEESVEPRDETYLKLRQKLTDALGTMQGCLRECNELGRRAVLNGLSEMQYVIPAAEKYQGIYANCVAQCLTIEADAVLSFHGDHVGDLDETGWECTARLCGAALNILKERDRRRDKYGYRVLNNYPTWAGIARVLADMKWKAPDAFRDSVMTPSEIVHRYTSTQRVEPSNSNVNLWLGLQAIKLAKRYDPSRAEALRFYYNDHNDGAADDHSMPFYYDLQIADLAINRPHDLTPQVYAGMNANRYAAMRRFHGSEYETAHYIETTTREGELLCEKACNLKLFRASA
jgi:hypothetical protein